MVTLAVLNRVEPDTAPASSVQGAEVPGGGWFQALAGARGPAGDAERTTCGLVLTDRSLGVTHAVLPCGARLILAYGRRRVLTEVIDGRLKSSGRQFELTDALVRVLGLDGTQVIRWRFALPDSG